MKKKLAEAGVGGMEEVVRKFGQSWDPEVLPDKLGLLLICQVGNSFTIISHFFFF